jgi:hypothetical protein
VLCRRTGGCRGGPPALCLPSCAASCCVRSAGGCQAAPAATGLLTRLPRRRPAAPPSDARGQAARPPPTRKPPTSQQAQPGARAGAPPPRLQPPRAQPPRPRPPPRRPTRCSPPPRLLDGPPLPTGPQTPANWLGPQGLPVRNDNKTGLAYAGKGNGESPPALHRAAALRLALTPARGAEPGGLPADASSTVDAPPPSPSCAGRHWS